MITDSDTTVLQLPPALLAQILSHMPQQHRLRDCAVVHTSWTAAATAGTTQVAVSIRTDEHLAEVEAWVGQHGAQLVSLELTSPIVPLVNSGHAFAVPALRLPGPQLAQLTSLQLSGVHVKLQDNAAAAAAADPTAALLPQLVTLSLKNCAFDSAESLLALAAATGITSLTFGRVRLTSGAPLTLDPTHAPPPQEAVQQGLDEYRSTAAAAANELLGETFAALLQRLTQLQDLSLRQHPFATSVAALEAVPASLTRLVVAGERAESDEEGGAFLPARFPQPMQHLRSLTLQYGSWHSGLLLDAPNLQQLDCVECDVLTTAAPQQDPGQAEPNPPLLRVLASLTELREIDLRGCECGWEQEAARSFAVLTARSGLRRLVIQEPVQTLQPGVVQQLFLPTRQLCALTNVTLESDSSQVDDLSHLGFISPAELFCLIFACPPLRHLGICNALQSGSAVPQLLQLPPCCASLSVGGVAFEDGAAEIIGRLAQLTCLHWSDSPNLSDLGLQQLTVLKGLEELKLDNTEGISQGACPRHDPWDEIFFGHCHLPGRPRKDPVWQQIDRCCDCSPLCAPARLLALRGEHAQLQLRVALLEQQLKQARLEDDQQSDSDAGADAEAKDP